jgi:CheY-like chemotaxis protein
MLGGDIAVSSVLGKGTTFRLTIASLPLDNAPSAQPSANVNEPEATTENDPPNLNCRILLAEDGLDNQRLLAFVLNKAGAEVAVVENGQKAVQHVVDEGKAERAVDLILMDMQMPVMDGYEAVRKLRAMGYRGPILALTAHAMKEDRQKCLDAGCDDYLEKPIDRGTLLRLVSMHVTRSQPDNSQSTGSLVSEHLA